MGEAKRALPALACLILLWGCTATPSALIVPTRPTPTHRPSSPEAGSGLTSGQVVRVVDGDTIRVTMPDGTEERVRFIGVDTPERGRPFFEEATNYTSLALSGKTVFLESDVGGRDRYGRLLAYVWTEAPTDRSESEMRTKMLNAKLLLDGYAAILTVPPNVRYVDTFRTFQREARELKKGLWNE